MRTVYSYRWGYIKVHREFRFPESPIEIRRLSVLSTSFDPSLTDYGYRPNIFENSSPEIFYGDGNKWGKMRPGTNFDAHYQTRYVPRCLVVANPGIEGIEWFTSDDLSQWDYQMTGQPGTGNAELSA